MSAASNEIEFSKQVRGALGNLYDPAALRASGLCGVLADDEFAYGSACCGRSKL